MSSANSFFYSSSKYKDTCKSADFECQLVYITTQVIAKEELSKFFYKTFAAFLAGKKQNKTKQNKNPQTNDHPEYFGIYCSQWSYQMRFKMVHSNIKS